MRLFAVALIALLCAPFAHGRVWDFAEQGAKAGDGELGACEHNTAVMNATLAALAPGDTLRVPNGTFWMAGGVYASGLVNATLQVDGTLKWSPDQKTWPRTTPGWNGKVREAMQIEGARGFTLTSSTEGTLDGNGEGWWGYVNYGLIGENRPRLFHMHNATDILVENIYFNRSAYWTTLFDDVARLEIRHCRIEARRSDADTHDVDNLGAFNTDGFDIAGRDVWVHDVDIWNQDDCVCVKEIDSNGINAQCSENMLFERVNASGLGLTVGSIGPSPHHTCVRNVTFRDSTMHNTYKGLYLKSRPGDENATGEITDVLYENIVLTQPEQWAIWIGPQQAIYSGACSLAWPFVPGAKCPVPSQITWKNIQMRNITVLNPAMSPGVVLGNATNPMQGVVFDDVVVTNGNKGPWNDKYYACDGVDGVATGGTSPAPPCFKQQ